MKRSVSLTRRLAMWQKKQGKKQRKLARAQRRNVWIRSMLTKKLDRILLNPTRPIGVLPLLQTKLIERMRIYRVSRTERCVSLLQRKIVIRVKPSDKPLLRVARIIERQHSREMRSRVRAALRMRWSNVQKSSMNTRAADSVRLNKLRETAACCSNQKRMLAKLMNSSATKLRLYATRRRACASRRNKSVSTRLMRMSVVE